MGLRRLAIIVLRQFLEGVVNILRDQAPFFDPAFLAAVGAHAKEAPLLLQYFDPVAIVDRPDLVVHGRDAIAQAGFGRGDVHVLVLGQRALLAGGCQRQQRQRHTAEKNSVVMRTARFHRQHRTL